MSNSQKGGASAFLKAEQEKEQALGAPDDNESMLLSGRDPEEVKKRATINFEETSEKVIQFSDTRHQTPDTRHQTPDTRHQTLDTRH